MKILALVSEAFECPGGMGLFNRDFFTALSSFDFVTEVVILPLVAPDPVGSLPPKIKQSDPLPGKISYARKSFQIFFGQGPFDLLFCGHLRLVPVAFFLAKMKGIPLWLQIHGIEAWQRPFWLYRWTAERTDFTTSVSRFSRRKFLSWAKMDPARVRVLPNTFSEKYSPQPASKIESLRRRFGLEGKKVLLTVARLSSHDGYKGHDRILKELPGLLKKHPDSVYLIVGKGKDRQRLEKMAQQMNVRHAVRFLGYIPTEELGDIYALADLFVLPSQGEGFGIVFLEAMACGIPVVAADCGGSADPLQDGRLGTLVPDELLGRVLEEMLEKRRSAPAPDLSAKVRAIFNRERFTAHLKDLFQDLLQNTKKKL